MADRRSIALILATAIAVPAEGLRQFAYYDPPGVLSVCYGSTTDVQAHRKYSLAECKARLDHDMLNAIDAVEHCHPGLPENVLASFSDAVYNIGPKVACDSTASKMLAAGRFKDACNQLPLWNKSRVAGVLVPLPGLTSRRAKEQALCLGGVA